MSNRTAALLTVFFFGLAIMIGGFYYATVAPVKCSGEHDKVMHSGDVCKSYRRATWTYEEMVGTQRVMGWIGVGLGAAVIVYGIRLSIRSSRGSAAPQNGPPQPRSQPYHPPQYYPQQPYPPPQQYPPPTAGPYRPPPHYPPPNYPPPSAGPYRPPPSGR